jgi:hypothetical protein
MWLIEMAPCQPTSSAMFAFNVVMNVIQTVALAYVAQRAVRKNREEAGSNGQSRD